MTTVIPKELRHHLKVHILCGEKYKVVIILLFCNCWLIFNLMMATLCEQFVECATYTSDWNIPQVKSFIGNRWWYRDWV